MKSAAKPTAQHNDWFNESLFNLIIDYYPEVWCRPYGTAATPENILPALNELKPGCVIVYAKGHSGTTTFASVLKTEHPLLGRDMPAAFRDYTRRTGARLFLYYSGMLDGLAGRRHPDWRQRDRNGKAHRLLNDFKNFLCWANCPLSDYFDRWVAVHLREMITRYDPDGIWVDGDWAGPCYCPRCEEFFRQRTGHKGPMPEFNLLTPAGIAWTRVWADLLHNWRLRFRNFIKELKPDCLYSAGNVTARREFSAAFDWRSGDWFSPNNHRLHMSMSARRYAVGGLPYDAYTCDTSFVHSRKEMPSRTKPLARILQEGATILANGGQWGYWTYPSGAGALVPSRMRRAAQAARFARERRGLMSDSAFVPETAVLNPEPAVYIWNECRPAIMGAAKALVALHRSPVFMDESDAETAQACELIVLPESRCIQPRLVGQLEAYVRRGGRLLTFGDAARHAPALQRLLGIRLARAAALDDGHVFLQNGEPTGVYAAWDRWRLREARELYPLYRSWDDSNPRAAILSANWPMHRQVDEEHPAKAGMPAATLRRLGRGAAVHVAVNLLTQYWHYGYPDQLSWLREILDLLQPAPLVRTDAPGFVELSLRRQGQDLLLHVVNGNPGRDISLVGSEDWWVDEIPAVGPYTFRIRCARRPERATWEPGGRPARCAWADGVLRASLPRLEIHTCLRLRRALT